MGWMRRYDISVIGVPEGKEREWGINNIWQIMRGGFPKLMGNIKLQIQETLWSLDKINIQKTTHKHILASEDRKKNVKVARAKDR